MDAELITASLLGELHFRDLVTARVGVAYDAYGSSDSHRGLRVTGAVSTGWTPLGPQLGPQASRTLLLSIPLSGFRVARAVSDDSPCSGAVIAEHERQSY